VNRYLAWALAALACFGIFTVMAVAVRIGREAGGPPFLTLTVTLAGLTGMYYATKGIIKAGK
jgi:hypothetical protein